MDKIKIAQIGCGGMGLRHAFSYVELKKHADLFDLVALCDLNAEVAEHVALEAEKELGLKPRIYTDFDTMLSEEKNLDAVDVVTDVGLHHSLTIKALESGLHVSVEKPMGVSVKACLQMIEAAEKAGKILVVQENHRRDPIYRLVKHILDKGLLGTPRLYHFASLSGDKEIAQSTAWRHIKNRGGFLLDYAVHETDVIQYFLGGVSRVYAETQLWEHQRMTTNESGWFLERYYKHRRKDVIETTPTVDVDSEDMCLGLMRFNSGAIGYYGRSLAAPGQPLHSDLIFCDDGSIELPSSRSGNAAKITRLGEKSPISNGEFADLVSDFRLDDLTSKFYGNATQLLSYEPPSNHDSKFIAMGLADFGESIINNRTPEVGGSEGLDAVALVYSILESGHSGFPVKFEDVAAGKVSEYQDEINASLGL